MSDSKASSEAPSEPGIEQTDESEQQKTSSTNESVITHIPVLHTAKRLKLEARKLDGMQRELYSLMGENAAPVVITPESKFKTRPEWQQRAAPWKLAEFSPKDGLKLKHWVRAASIADGTHDNPFARFNKETEVPQWSDNQYHLFASDSWSLEETRYLFNLASEYDSRWLVIADRYRFKPQNPKQEDDEMHDISEDEKSEHKIEETGDDNDRKANEESKDTQNKNSTEDKTTNASSDKNEKQDSNSDNKETDERATKKESSESQPKSSAKARGVDDLKERYYDVCRASIKNKPIATELGLSPHDEELLKAIDFNRENEMKRKAHLERLLSRNPKEVAEEEALILEARRLEGLASKSQSEREDLSRLLDSPTNLTNANALKLELSTSHGVGQLSQDLSSDKSKRTLSGANASTRESTPKLASDREAVAANGGSASAARRAVAKIVSATLNHDLTKREEAMLGISYTENTKAKAPGVYLRSSKLTPVRQSLLPKMRAITAESGLPLRPVMPTQQVCAKYEQLYQSITSLLEAKKVQDKLEMEVEVLQKARSASEPAEEELA